MSALFTSKQGDACTLQTLVSCIMDPNTHTSDSRVRETEGEDRRGCYFIPVSQSIGQQHNMQAFKRVTPSLLSYK